MATPDKIGRTLLKIEHPTSSCLAAGPFYAAAPKIMADRPPDVDDATEPGSASRALETLHLVCGAERSRHGAVLDDECGATPSSARNIEPCSVSNVLGIELLGGLGIKLCSVSSYDT